jgi:large subunit ribosomal protein L2
MGKNLIQQKRGKGGPTWRANGFNSEGDVKTANNKSSATVIDLVTSRFHSAPLAKIKYNDGEAGLLIAPEGMKVGDTVQIGAGDIAIGNIMALKDVPDGALIYNVESQPGDGGKFARGSGVAARVLSRTPDRILVMLPSKKQRAFHPDCRASLGTVAGGGRPEKPFVKAGNMFYQMKSKNRYWPRVVGAAMNAVSHPFGGKRTSRKGRPTIAPKNAPPGRMVGMIRPRKTGRARGTRVRVTGGETSK